MVYEDKKTKTLKLDGVDKLVGLMILGFPVVAFLLGLAYLTFR